MDLKVGLNPYGLTCSIGIQGSGTHKGSSKPLGLQGFVELSERLGARCIEFHWSHLAQLTRDEIQALREKLETKGIEPVVSSEPPVSKVVAAVDAAALIGARTVRTGLSRVLCGDRAIHQDWKGLVTQIRSDLREFAPYAGDRGLCLAIENHQDFGSEELVEFCDISPGNIGITFDTGNPFAVGEAPLAFARVIKDRVRHLHLKDYRAQFTDEGFRLVRCAIGDGAVPLIQIREILSEPSTLRGTGQSEGVGGSQPTRKELTASLEPGALEHRHIRLLTQDWWRHYPARTALELAECLKAARRNHLPENEECRTPWERDCPGDEICEFEVAQVMRSVENMKAIGWMQ